MATKAALRQPNSLEFDITDEHHEDELDAIVLDQSIRNALPDNLLDYYDKMLSGEKVPSRIKKQIRDIATEIINDA
jgi:replication-associated recombination protein RarA